MKKILIIGHAAYDTTLVVEDFPKEDNKYKVLYSVECGGGQAMNTSYLLGSWNIPNMFVGCVGNDIYGEQIKNDLYNVGVDITNLVTFPNSFTDKTYILVNQVNGSRTCFTEHFKRKYKISFNNLDNLEYILMDGTDALLASEIINKNPRAITLLNASTLTPSIKKLCLNADYIIASHNFAEEFTKIKIDTKNKFSMMNAFNILERNFKGNIIITMGNSGCIYKNNGIISLMPTLKVNVEDTTGAGDIFFGAFLYGLINNYRYEEIIKISTIAASLSVTNIGTKYSIPNLNNVLEIYRNVR